MTARFGNEVSAVLTEFGWEPGRDIRAAAMNAIVVVTGERARDGSRHEPFGAVLEALAEFGELFVDQDGAGVDLRRRPFAIDPTMVPFTAATLADFGRVLGRRLFPLGMEGNDDALLAIDEDGRVFALDHAGEWFLGETMDAALTTLITGTQPPRLRDDGTW